MGLRDTLKQRAALLVDEGAERVNGYVASRGLGPRLAELIALKDDLPVTPQELLVWLVDAVHADEEPARGYDVERIGRRNERIALAVKALPTAGIVAGYVADLYCDAAIVCGVVDTHRLGLSDEEIGARLLVLWGATPDIASAREILAGNTQLLLEQASDKALESWNATSKVAIVKMLWQFRRAGLRVAGERNVRGFIAPRRLVHERMLVAEHQLADWYADPFGGFDHRYWDGAWTEHVSRDGVQLVDPPDERAELPSP